MRAKTLAIAACAYIAGAVTVLAFSALRAPPVPEPATDPSPTASTSPRNGGATSQRVHVDPERVDGPDTGRTVEQPASEKRTSDDEAVRGTVLRGRLTSSDPDTDFGAYSVDVMMAPLGDSEIPVGGGADPDADGRFAVSVSGAFRGAPYDIEVTVSVAGAGVHVTSASLHRARLGAEVDLGDVAIDGDAAVLVAGRAVTSDGAPAAGAGLTLAFVSGRSTRYDSRYDVEADADGRFEIRGESDGSADLSVKGTGGWATAYPVPFEAGARDLTVVVDAVARITGRIESTTGLPLDSFEVVVLGEHAGAESLDSDHGWSKGPSGFSIPARVSFLISGAPAGTYRLGLRRKGSEKLLAETAEFRVVPPSTTAPTLVTQTAVRTMGLVVRGPAGAPLPGARVAWRDATDAGAFAWVDCDDSGLASWQFGADTLELVVHAHGYRVAHLETPDDALQLDLQPASPLPVRIRMPAGLAAVPEGVEAWVRLIWGGPPDAGSSARDAHDGSHGFRAADVEIPIDVTAAFLETSVSEPGEYAIQLGGRRAGSSATTTGSFRFQVPAGSVPITTRLPFSKRDVDEHLRDVSAE